METLTLTDRIGRRDFRADAAAPKARGAGAMGALYTQSFVLSQIEHPAHVWRLGIASLPFLGARVKTLPGATRRCGNAAAPASTKMPIFFTEASR